MRRELFGAIFGTLQLAGIPVRRGTDRVGEWSVD